jgi:hypothetical protein
MKIGFEKVKEITKNVFINDVRKMTRCINEKSRDIYKIK